MKKAVLAWIIAAFVVLSGVMVYSSTVKEGGVSAHAGEGYSIAYYENNEIAFQNHGDGISERSVFELASNGKTVSAYIALKMVDEGKLHLEDKIAPFLDDDLLTEDERIYDITLKQLLCHTAGFSPSYEFGIDKKIYTDPGEEFRYSGVGYIYLQNVIENVGGMPIEEAADYYVFAPLGMNHSTFEHAQTVTPYMNLSSVVMYIFAVFLTGFIVLLLFAFVVEKIAKRRFLSHKSILAAFFVMAGVINMLFLLFVFVSKVAVSFGICFVCMGLVLLVTRKNTKIFYAAIPAIVTFILILGFLIPVNIPVTNDLVAKGANCAYTFKSTGEDMSVFCRELMRQYHREDGAVKDMFSAAVEIDAADSWGLGIAIEAERQGETYWHSGINPGFQSLFVLYPMQDKYVVILTNSDDGLLFAKEAAKDFLEVDGRWEIRR